MGRGAEDAILKDRDNWCHEDWDQISEIMAGCPGGGIELTSPEFSTIDYFQGELLRYLNRDMQGASGIFNQLICAVGCPV